MVTLIVVDPGGVGHEPGGAIGSAHHTFRIPSDALDEFCEPAGFDHV